MWQHQPQTEYKSRVLLFRLPSYWISRKKIGVFFQNLAVWSCVLNWSLTEHDKWLLYTWLQQTDFDRIQMCLLRRKWKQRGKGNKQVYNTLRFLSETLLFLNSWRQKWAWYKFLCLAQGGPWALLCCQNQTACNRSHISATTFGEAAVTFVTCFCSQPWAGTRSCASGRQLGHERGLSKIFFFLPQSKLCRVKKSKNRA